MNSTSKFINLNKTQSMWLLHIMLSVIVFINPVSALNILLVLVASVYFNYKKQYANVLITGLYAVCAKSESVFFVYAISVSAMVLFSKKKYELNRVSKVFLGSIRLISIYLIFIYILQLFDEKSILSLPMFLITFATSISVVFFILKNEISELDKEYVLANLFCIAFVQATIALVFQGVPTGIIKILNRPTLGDVVMGTTNSPNALSFIMLATAIPYLISTYKNWNLSKLLPFTCTAFFYLFIFILNDSKTTLACFVVAMSFTLGLTFWLNLLNPLHKIITLCICFIVVITSSFYFDSFVEQLQDKYEDYISGKYNAKYRYYSTALSSETRPNLYYWLGTGAGTNGSRAGNALAYDVMYKKQNTFALPKSVPAKSNAYTRKYLSTYYTKEYAEASAERSAVLGNPFNSFCAIFVEFGVIGTCIFIASQLVLIVLLVQKGAILDVTATILIISNFLIGFLDQSYERPSQAFTMYLMLGLAMANIKPNKPQKSI
ncbi:MAG: hypothetical protein U0V72_01005 [Cytophagales bacterium]